VLEIGEDLARRMRRPHDEFVVDRPRERRGDRGNRRQPLAQVRRFLQALHGDFPQAGLAQQRQVHVGRERDERLIRPNGSGVWTATHLTESAFEDGDAGISEQKRSAPILLIFLGGGDLFDFVKGLDPQADFSLNAIPFDTNQFPARPISAMLDQKLVLESVGQILGPLFRGLRLFERAGFSNIYLHTIPPETVDDREYERLSGHFAPVALRYKSEVLFNAMFREFARQNPRIGLIDTWNQTTVGGKRDDRFSLDGFHLNKLGARLTIEQLVQQLDGRRNPLPPSPSPDLTRVVSETSRIGETDASPFRASTARFSDMHEVLEESRWHRSIAIKSELRPSLQRLGGLPKSVSRKSIRSLRLPNNASIFCRNVTPKSNDFWRSDPPECVLVVFAAKGAGREPQNSISNGFPICRNSGLSDLEQSGYRDGSAPHRSAAWRTIQN